MSPRDRTDVAPDRTEQDHLNLMMTFQKRIVSPALLFSVLSLSEFSLAQSTAEGAEKEAEEGEGASTASPDNQDPEDPESAPPPKKDVPAKLGLEERIEQAEANAAEARRENEELRRRNEEFEQRLEDLQADQEWTEQRVDSIMPVSVRLSGYVDVGAFYVGGDGRGIQPDTGHANFPEYDGVVPDSWVFMGDPLSTAINSRGDVADLTESRAVVSDPIHSGGHPSFLVNNVNVQFFGGIGKHVTVNAMVDFLPRSRNSTVVVGGNGVGDYVDVKLGYLEYRGQNKVFDVELSAGKFDSVLGREYRRQEAPDRLTVTPSLICRYTCGRPTGLKSRFSFFDKAVTLNAAVTNGSYFIEAFPFSSETDTNNFKTVGGRLSWALPVLDTLEIGASGAYGAQDFQEEDDVLQRHFGFDILVEAENFRLTGEFVRGEVSGQDDPAIAAACAVSPCLTYQGGYAQLGYRANNWFIPYVRGDIRDALMESGASFVYISKDIRATAGARFEVFPELIVKGEYTFNREFGGVPEFKNDLMAASLIGKF